VATPLRGRAWQVLIHPLSGNDYDDHAHYASWLGPQLPLNLDFLLELQK
jgi:aromatic ring-cleaving dioxygenase